MDGLLGESYVNQVKTHVVDSGSSSRPHDGAAKRRCRQVQWIHHRGHPRLQHHHCGPGLFIGSTSEMGRGDARPGVSEGEYASSGDGEYVGNFTERGPGACFIKDGTASELPT